MEYDNSIIALSAGIGFIGVYAAVSLCEQFRLSTVSNLGVNNKSWVVMAFGAMALGGIGIWCLHFVAVSAFSVSLHGDDVPIRYNVGMLVISLVVVVSCQFFSLWVASTDVCFNKSKKEIIEMFIARASKSYTMREIKQMSRLRILTIVCTHNLNRIVIGGMLRGSGVILMHYLGMMAMEFQGTVKFNYGAVAAVIIMSLGGATGAFITFYRVLSIFLTFSVWGLQCLGWCSWRRCITLVYSARRMTSTHMLRHPTRTRPSAPTSCSSGLWSPRWCSA